MKELVAIILLLSFPLTIRYPFIFIPIYLILGSLIYYIVSKTSHEIERENEKISHSIREATSKYEKLKLEVDIPTETRIVYYEKGDENILEGSLQTWLQEGVLYFFPFIPIIDKPINIDRKVYLLKININNIEYFSKDKKAGTILKYINKGQEYEMVFSNRDYKVFKELIGGKDYKLFKKENKVG